MKRIATYRRKVDSLPTLETEQKANVTIVKSTLKILPRHNGIVPIKIKGHTMKGHMAYFISEQDSKKGKDPPHTSLMEFITSKEKHMLMFSSQTMPANMSPSTKGKHVGHQEPPIEDMQQTPEDSGSQTAHSITMKKMMAEKVEPDTYKLPCHMLRKDIETKLEELLKEYQSQFTQDKTSMGTTPLTKVTIDTGDSGPVSQIPYPIAV